MVAAVMIPRDLWITIGVIAAIAAAVYAYVRWQSNASQLPPAEPIDQGPTLAELMSPPRRTGMSTAKTSPQSTAPQHPARSEDFYAAGPGRQHTSIGGYSIPPAPAGFTQGRWIPPDEVIEVAGTPLSGGMLYVGTTMAAANDGSTDPCLINPRLSVARSGDFRERHTNYWPSYCDISSTGRRAYLNWLADGRSHPECDIGYVFLFFYGLERRIIHDTRADDQLKSEWPAIRDELRRLLAIYSEQSGSFRRYAGELLNYIELAFATDRLYEQTIPDLPRTYELPPYIRLALGQAAVDRVPVPAQLALAWVRLNPETYLRTAATRCPEEFERLFVLRYHDALGDGLVLPKNRTKLKLVYQAASSGFHGSRITMTYGDVPDVTALIAPIRTLNEIVSQCTDELGPFSRAVGKDASVRDSLDGLLMLPATLWPPEASQRLKALTDSMKGGMLTRSLHEIVADLGGASSDPTRDRVRALARSLESVQIGMEPNVLAGARTPSATDPIVLFAIPAMEPGEVDSAAFRTAALTLQLASAVAQADGTFNEHEIDHLRSEIESWSHLTPPHRQRLHAHLQWLVASPVSLQSLKRKLEPMELRAKEAVATFMATVAQSDGVVSPEEVKFLEKVYKALGVNPKRVFTDVHALEAGTAPTRGAERKGFQLDAERIATLQADTARVSALLSEIFTEEHSPPPEAQEAEAEPEAQSGFLGLDQGHGALLRLMLSRPEWSREELADAATDLELMLDGALEQINDASFDAFDLPLCEGDDPIEINSEVVEKIES
ncbi:MAG: TerB N-terminal domain-containing protein [Pseudomonadota bacterium]|nr:TerB N-terminal domain-containing protein [Pseudomonadota bacterium]